MSADHQRRREPGACELIESCTDLDTLNGWFRRAFKVDKASDHFQQEMNVTIP